MGTFPFWDSNNNERGVWQPLWPLFPIPPSTIPLHQPLWPSPLPPYDPPPLHQKGGHKGCQTPSHYYWSPKTEKYLKMFIFSSPPSFFFLNYISFEGLYRRGVRGEWKLSKFFNCGAYQHRSVSHAFSSIIWAKIAPNFQFSIEKNAKMFHFFPPAAFRRDFKKQVKI